MLNILGKKIWISHYANSCVVYSDPLMLTSLEVGLILYSDIHIALNELHCLCCSL